VTTTGEVDMAKDIRTINQRIRKEMDHIREREELTELKKRSDYLCALPMAPSWKDKFGRRIGAVLKVARGENRKTSEYANSVARQHGWSDDYDPWGGE